MVTMIVRCSGRGTDSLGRGRRCPAKLVGPTCNGYPAASGATQAALRAAGWEVRDLSSGGTIRVALCPEHR
jgi:hypothetical protein